MIAMKRYFYILFVGVLLSLTSCVQEDVYVDDIYTPSANSGIQFVGAVEDFDKHNVATRAEGGVSDAHVSEMTMIIFKGDGTMLPAFDAEQKPLKSNHINIRRSNPTFLIEATRYKGKGIIASMEAGVTAKYYNNLANDLGACRIYIVANAYHLIGERLEVGDIQTEAQLLEALVATDTTLKMPEDSDGNPIGLPMIGTHGDDTFDLSYKTENKNNSVATISMKKLYSKVEFTIQVKSNQVVVGQTPKFTLEDVEIYNIPSKIRMDHVDGDYVDVICGGNLSESNIADWYLFNSVKGDAKHLALPSKTTAYHDTSVTTDEKIEFVFYMPEHMVTPNTITYPTNIPNSLKQYYKPKGVDAVRNGDGTTSPSKIAPFVRLIGSYTDHNAQINKVSYDIYLGQNNTDNFEVKRNQRLCNYVTITGLTNHKDAYPDVEGNVSIDHRVTMTSKGYNLSMEREAILDAHFEVRPLDVELSPGSSMTVVIPEDYKSMIAFESDTVARKVTGDAKNLYIDNSKERKGVRKYFTTNLVSELWTANEGKIELKHSGATDENGNPKTEIHRIWFYVDENPNVYDKLNKGLQNGESGYIVSTTLYRNAKVNFFFASDNATPDLSAEPSSTINFQQWNLWRVWNTAGTRYYDIEHEEEYLNNYVSDAQYGSSENGMPWGLEGIQLSDSVMAYWAEKVEHSTGGGIWDLIVGWVVGLLDSWLDITGNANKIFAQSNLKPYYDFYLTRDNFPITKLQEGQNASDYQRDFNGLVFNKEIATTLKALQASTDTDVTTDMKAIAKIDGITLTENPKSAFAYCYHKNKRNEKGEVVDQKWFLPAIDEIEEIALGAYAEFDKVFQNQIYWSCQPAYDSNSIVINPYRSWGNNYTNYSQYITVEGAFYDDNLYRARATSVYSTDGTTYQAIKSGLPNDVLSGKLTVNAYSGGSKDGQAETDYDEYDIDYSATLYTTGEYRGNKSRSDIARIRAVYRSGSTE